MSDDFSLLGHLGVSVPSVTSQPAAPRSQQRVTTSRILVPKERPPLPARGQQPGGSARRARRPPTSSTNIITGEQKPMFVPTGEVRTEKSSSGLETEYHIFNSNLPSNMAYNQMLIEKHRAAKAKEAEAKQHFDPSLNSMAFEDHAKTITAEDRLRERAAQQHDLDARNKLKAETRAQQIAAERKIAEENAAQEAKAKEEDYQKKKAAMTDAAAQQKELLQKAREAKLAKRKAEVGSAAENQGLGIGDQSGPDPAAARERRDKLQEVWKQQMTEREMRAKETKARDQKIAQEALATARAEENVERKSRAEAAAIMQAQHAAHEKRKQEQEIEKHNRMANERRTIIEEDQRRQAEKQAELQHKIEERNAIQASIKQQLSEKEMHKKAQQALERAIDRGNDRYSRRTEHDVLLRCPVSKQLLPPSHYNIPLNQRPTPMLAKSEGKVTDLRDQEM